MSLDFRNRKSGAFLLKKYFLMCRKVASLPFTINAKVVAIHKAVSSELSPIQKSYTRGICHSSLFRTLTKTMYYALWGNTTKNYYFSIVLSVGTKDALWGK